VSRDARLFSRRLWSFSTETGPHNRSTGDAIGTEHWFNTCVAYGAAFELRTAHRSGEGSGNIGSQNPGDNGTTSLPMVVDRDVFQVELDLLPAREKAHTREGDAIAARRRRLPMVEMDANLKLIGPKMRRVYVVHDADRGAIPPPFSRHHFCDLRSGPPTTKASAIGTSWVGTYLGTRRPGLSRRASCRARNRTVPPCVLPKGRRSSF